MSADSQKVLDALRAKREDRRQFESSADDLLSALEGVLRHVVPPVEFEYLRKGIGTNTPKGKALIAARAAIAKATGSADPLDDAIERNGGRTWL
jgi:hypothetical protein